MGNGPENVRAIVAAVCRVSVEDDGMAFDPAGMATSRIAEDADREEMRAGAAAGFLRPACSALVTGQQRTSVWQPGGPWLP